MVRVREYSQVCLPEVPALVHGLGTSPFGPCELAAVEGAICWLQFVEGETKLRWGRFVQAWLHARLQRDDGWAARLLSRIFSNDDGEVAVLLLGSPFQLDVWRATLEIPRGEVLTYAQLAARIGRPGAARAVGRALAANPVAYLVPCHRVVAQGSLGGYSGGLARKRAILAWEGAPISDQAYLAAGQGCLAVSASEP
jgi:AraC family transcriptional regulator of adaptative response/methylated-DNA-[protein]-cysteine methyltransferase